MDQTDPSVPRCGAWAEKYIDEMPETERQRSITPKCCADAQRYPVVYLSFDSDAIYECHDDGQDSFKPRWFSTFRHHETSISVPVSHCPFCAAPVPEIRRRKTGRKKVCKIVDGGDYCATCGERLRCCECYYPEYAWEPVP